MVSSASLRLLSRCLSERLRSLPGAASRRLRGLRSASPICQHYFSSTQDFFRDDGLPPPSSSGLCPLESEKPQGFVDNVAVGTQSSLLFDFRLPDISQAKPESSTSYDSLLPQIADLPSTSSSINGAPMEKLEAHADRVVFGTVFSPRGVYKAILLGEVGQSPIQKILKSGRAVTIFSVATGGMHNNRRPLEGESPEEYAQRGYAQWHRVAVYQERMGQLAMRHIKQGTQVYLEGNIETRVYNEPVHGAVKHIREIAIRQNGRLLFMDQVSSSSSSYSSSSSPSSAVAPTIDQESSSVAATLPTAISQNSSFAAAATIYDKAFVAENASNGRESASSWSYSENRYHRTMEMELGFFFNNLQGVLGFRV